MPIKKENKNKSKKPAITVICIPIDILKYILTVQGEMKSEKCIGQISQSSSIIKIIREHKENRESTSKIK